MLSDVWIIKHLTSRIMILTLISWMVRSGCCLIPTRDIVTLAVSVLQCNQKVYPEKIKPIQVPWYFLWIFLVKKEVGSMSHLSNRILRNYKNAFCLYLLMVSITWRVHIWHLLQRFHLYTYKFRLWFTNLNVSCTATGCTSVSLRFKW